MKRSTPSLPRAGTTTRDAILRCLICAAVALVSPHELFAQSIEALTASLNSTDVLTRGDAVARLSQMPLSDLPLGTKTALIDLLEREAVGTEPRDPDTAGEDEAWTEYLIALVDVVRTLNDGRALRGMSLLGIQTSRASQEVVAGFGSQALVPLQEAWDSKPNARPSIVTVWAMMTRTADSTTRSIAMQRLLSPDDTFPIAIADGAMTGNLVSLVPFLDSLGRSPTLRPRLQRAVREAADSLRPQFAVETSVQLLAQYNDWLTAICRNSTGALNGYCESSLNGVDNSTKHLLKNSVDNARAGNSSQASQELGQVLDRTLSAISNGVLSPWQGMLLVTGLRQAILRIGF